MAKNFTFSFGSGSNASERTFSNISDSKYEQVLADYKNGARTITFTKNVDGYTGNTFTIRTDYIDLITLTS